MNHYSVSLPEALTEAFPGFLMEVHRLGIPISDQTILTAAEEPWTAVLESHSRSEEQHWESACCNQTVFC